MDTGVMVIAAFCVYLRLFRPRMTSALAKMQACSSSIRT